MQRIIGRKGAHGDEDQWLSVSDLMAGLMVIFLFIAIIYIRPIVEQQNAIREIVVAWNNSELDIYKALEEEFREDLPKWDAALDQKTLMIRFKAPDVLFEQNRATLTPRFKHILSDFFPRYLDVLSEFRVAIEEIRIEGHTSSEWSEYVDEMEAYFLNMALSQDRTRTVLRYCLSLPPVSPHDDWARSVITANGLSSSRLIMVNGVEDHERSRRVEFRIKTNTKEQIVRILETVK